MKLWLDDIRTAPEGWVWVKTYQQAIRCLRGGEVDEISFDYDLGYKMTGCDVAKWIDDKVRTDGFRMPEWKIHAENKVGRDKIEKVMRSAWRSWGVGVKIQYRRGRGKWTTLWTGDTNCMDGCLDVGWTKAKAIRKIEEYKANDKKSERWDYRVVGDENERNDE